ncbi:MAG: aquaporin [Actinobacteria bacterium]|nr:aquaporin [Actinomycetota bacterium]
MDETYQRQLVAEFIGTFALVFIGAGSVILATQPGGGYAGLLGVALAHGLVLAVMVSVLGHISGGHFNPAVTIGAWVVRKIDGFRAVLYVVTQVLAGIAAAGLLRVVLPDAALRPGGGEIGLGNTTVNSAVGLQDWQAVLIEAILTFFLLIAVFGTAVDERGPFGKTAGLTIGLVLTFDILMGGPLTGASMNPARSLGPAVVSGNYADIYVYLIGPVSGGVIGATTYWFAFLRGRERITAPPSEVPMESTDQE